jgi:hypothetical protein
MNKTEIKKLSSLLKKFSQKEAVYEMLANGVQPSVEDMKFAGIKDPRRVINHLRSNHGAPIYLNTRKDKSGQVTRRYRLAN